MNAIIAITKNGIDIAQRIKNELNDWVIYAPDKFTSTQNHEINWYAESTTNIIKQLFKNSKAMICIFSLGAVIRLIAPHLVDKKTDPAILIIDDQANFVISGLSGHLGGANEITNHIAQILDATPVITTAADVNKTIAVDMLGRKLGWKIEDQNNITKVSAFMVNKEPIGVYQDVGSKEWREKLPTNVTVYESIEKLLESDSVGCLIISDKILDKVPSCSVVYRPPSLVIGIGIHKDTKFEKILDSIQITMHKFKLSEKSIFKFVSIKKDTPILGLQELERHTKIPLEYITREELAKVQTPNPSKIVKAFEGTASVSEAAALKISQGILVVEKQKFPPDLTLAIASVEN